MIYNAKTQTILNILEFTASLITDDTDLLDYDEIEFNIEQCSREFNEKENRSILRNRLDYLADNYIYILLGALVCEDYLALLRQCIFLEAEMMFRMPEDLKDYIRELTSDPVPEVPVNPVNLTTIDTSVDICDDPYFKLLIARIKRGLRNCDEAYNRLFAAAVSKEPDMECISYVISNFYFLLMAYAKNDDLYGKTKSLVDVSKATLKKYRESYDSERM
ncbi:MAG: hypothetical protein K6A80_03135 [Saccharofermentans sp.]|nr:hypothetical protein [Saccharofermentans sp.]